MKKQIIAVSAIILLLGLMSSSVWAITIQELTAKVESELTAIEDFRGVLTINQVTGERTEEMKMQIGASQVLGIARLEVIDHWLFEGMIFVADQESAKVRTYTPILHQIMVGNIEDLGAEAGLALDFTDLTSVFDLQTLETELVDIKHSDTGDVYVVRLSGVVDQVQYIWIDHQFRPYQLEVYEEERFVGSMILIDLVVNPGLTTQQLTDLPEVPEVRF